MTIRAYPSLITGLLALWVFSAPLPAWADDAAATPTVVSEPAVAPEPASATVLAWHRVGSPGTSPDALAG